MLAYNALDLIAWRIVMEDVKLELKLLDWQLGLLTGFAYSLFYGLAGLPMARLADRGYRVAVLSASAAVSGVMVALIGTAQSFAHLFLIRVFVAVGDAGCMPASQTLVASNFARSERAHATSLMFLVTALSGVLGPPLVGWLNQAYGWRATFLMIGPPGVALACMGWWLLRGFENQSASGPGSGEAPNHIEVPDAAATWSYRETLGALWATPTFRFTLIGGTIVSFLGTGLGKWDAVFFRRVHGMETAELGLWFGFVGFVGLLSLYGGGYLASRYAPNNERLQLKAMAIAYAGYSVLAVTTYIAPDYRIAFVFKALDTAVACLVLGPLYALQQSLFSPDKRATSFAVLAFFYFLIGGGIGPVAVGALSDALQPFLGSESIRYALLAASPGFLLGGWCFVRASRTAMEDIARASVN